MEVWSLHCFIRMLVTTDRGGTSEKGCEIYCNYKTFLRIHFQEVMLNCDIRGRDQTFSTSFITSSKDFLCMLAAIEVQGEGAVAPEEDAATPAEAPVIMLGPLEKSSVDELSDGVQSMDVR